MSSSPGRISDLLAESLREADGGATEPNPRIGEIVSSLGTRSFGVVLVLFGLPNLLPIPGLPMLCGVIVGVVAVQMLLGKDQLVLPRWLSERRMSRKDLGRVLDKLSPSLRAVESVMKERFLLLTDGQAQQVIGGAVLVLAVLLMAPIPFFGGIPPGIAVILFGLALAARDGALAIAASLATVFAFVFTVALTYAIVKALVVFVMRFIGLA